MGELVILAAFAVTLTAIACTAALGVFILTRLARYLDRHK